MARNFTSSTELRVGIMFITGLILLVLAFVTLQRWQQDRGTFIFEIQFQKVQGLQRGAEVRVSGVKVGYVSEILLHPEARNLVGLRVKIADYVVIYTRDIYTIGIGSLVGERFVEISPGSGDRGERVGQDSVVAGTASADFDTVMTNANALVEDLQTTTSGLNSILGDPTTQANLRRSITNLNTTLDNTALLTGHLNQTLTRSETSLAEILGSTARLTRRLDTTLARSETAIDVILANISTVSSDLRKVSDTLTPRLTNTKLLANLETASANIAGITTRVSALVDAAGGVLNDKELAASLRKTLANLVAIGDDLVAVTAQAKTASAALPKVAQNLQTASDALPKITANMQTASADLTKITKPFAEVAPETATNILTISQRLRRTSEQVGDIAEEVTEASSILINTRAVPEARLLGLTGGASSPRSDLNVDVRLENNMFRTGVTDIARASRFNLQFGNQVKPGAWIRYGLIESRFGLGVDYTVNPNTHLHGELFDPASPRANAFIDLRMKPLGAHWWFTSGWYGLHDLNSFAAGLTFRED